MKPSLKELSVLLVAVFTLYPPLELTRLILYQLSTGIVWNYRVFQPGEIVYIWASFIAAMIIVYKMANEKGITDEWQN